MVSILASRPSSPGFDAQRSQKSEVNQLSCLEEKGQWSENVYRTHLVLASGKLVLQTNIEVKLE